MKVGCLVIAAVIGGGGVAAADPLDVPFAASAAVLRSAANAAPAGTDTVVLRLDQRIEIDARHRMSMTTRMVVLVRTADAADRLRTVGKRWDPSANTVALRARVLDQTGKLTELDPHAIAIDAAAGTLHATLPVDAGGVFEEEISSSETAAPFATAERTTEWFYASLSATFTLVAPAGLVPAPVLRGPQHVTPSHTVVNGRETWRYAFGPIASDASESGVPDDVFQFPTILHATAKTTWAAVAKAHRTDEDRRITGAPAPPAGVAHTPAGVLAWARQAVALAPSPPGRSVADILADKRGSPADLALVTAFALRLAGIPAEAMLLAERGVSADLAAGLPGDHLTDTVLVRAHPGGATVWLDPGSLDAPAGTLPCDCYGRHALAIAAGTTGLVETPPMRAADHEQHELDTIALAEKGNAQLVVREWGTGALGERSRRWMREGGDDDAFFTTEAGIRRGTLVSHVHDLPATLETPASTTATFAKVASAAGDGTAIEVASLVPHALANVPDAMLQREHDDDPPRTLDFAWPRPRIIAVETRIPIPPGYAPPAIVAAAADDKHVLGPATLTTHRAIEGGDLVIRTRFDPGKARMTGAEYTAMHRSIIALRAEHRANLRFVAMSETLALAGKFPEAVEQERRMVALHPHEALHHHRLAEMFTGLAMTAAAVREERAANAADPNAADPMYLLAGLLARDAIGREWVDWDRAGALAAARRAAELAPASLAVAVLRAQITERETTGALHDGPDADAIAAWERAVALPPTDDTATRGLYFALARTRDAKLEATVRAHPPGLARDGALLYAIARARGDAPAVTEADRLRTGDEREEIVARAVQLAVVLRDYNVARLLAPHLGSIGAGAAKIPTLQRAPAWPATDPRAAVLALVRAALDPTHAPAAPVLDPAAITPMRAAVVAAPSFSKFVPDTVPRLLDEEAALLRADGAPTGPWRVEAPAAQIIGDVIAYVAVDRGVTKVIGDAHDTRTLRPYFAAHGPGDPQARAVLAWLVKDNTGPMVAAWKGVLPADPGDLAIAVALFGSDIKRDAPVLAKCAPKVPVTGLRAICDQVLADLLSRSEQWSQLEAHAKDIAAHGDAATAARARLAALIGLRRFDEAAALVDAVAAADPHADAGLMRGQIALTRGDVPEAIRQIAQASSVATVPQAANALAWLRAFADRDLTEAQRVADAALALDREPNILNTRAVIAAERGELATAVALLREGVPRSTTARLGDGDRYVLGRIAEQLGLRADAIGLYKQIGKRKASSVDSGPSSFDFAQRRLATP